MGIKDNYITEMTRVICSADPSMKEEDVIKFVTKTWKMKLKNPTINMDNNVTGHNEDIKLTGLCDWIDGKKPVVSGNATFYMQPSVLISPTSRMLRKQKASRKTVKRQMFDALKAGNMELFAALNLSQLNIKVAMNAEYGGSGAKTAAFYNPYSPPATTLMAQSIITVMAAFFEGYVGDNQIYFNINECIDWMRICESKKFKIPKWIYRPTSDEVFIRIKSHFRMFDPYDHDMLKDYIQNMTSDQLVFVYYANNMKSFIGNHDSIKTAIHNILTNLPSYEAAYETIPKEFSSKFKSNDDYNEWMSKVMFLNPYDIPDVIKSDMDYLREMFYQFMYVEYITPDSIVKLNNHKRNTVLLVDTDSNVINSDIFVDFILNDVFKGETFGRNQLYNDMITVNIIASLLDDVVSKTLDYFGRCRNMDPEARSELTMKNEFMFRTLFLMDKKKRYAASLALREGVMMVPFDTEIKGVDFIKAGVSDEVTDIFTGILERNVLYPDVIDVKGMINDIRKFENDIRYDLHNGGVHYLKLGKLKADAGYKKETIGANGRSSGGPWRIQSYKASHTWNEIYPDNKIFPLDRIRLIKLTITSEDDLDKIKDSHPDDYKLIKQKIYRSENPNILKYQLKVLAIPAAAKEIPSWIIPFIDYDMIVSDITRSFKSILDVLGVEIVKTKTPNGQADIISSLISI